MGRHEAVVADGTPESVERDLAVMNRWVRHRLVRQLVEGERIVIRTRQHPVSLARPAAWTGAALVVCLWLWGGAEDTGPIARMSLVAFGLTLVWLAAAETSRRFRWIVVTDKRILKHEGVYVRHVPIMRLTKVTDLTFQRSVMGELLGYGTIIIESAGQHQAIRDLTFLPDPDEVSAALNAQLFQERPRRRADDDRRRSRFTSPSWRWGGGEGPGRDTDEGPPRGRGPGPRDNSPSGAPGGVDVSGSGHPEPPHEAQEGWRRSSNLGAPAELGDTGELPVVDPDDVRRWRDAGRPGAPDPEPGY